MKKLARYLIALLAVAMLCSMSAMPTMAAQKKCTASKHYGTKVKKQIHPATCKSKAEYKYVCSKCGKQLGKTFTEGKKKNHTYKWHTEGSKDVCRIEKCSSCGAKSGKIKKHDYKWFTVGEMFACKAEKCSICGRRTGKTEGHSFKWINYCDYSFVKECTRCGYKIWNTVRTANSSKEYQKLFKELLGK